MADRRLWILALLVAVVTGSGVAVAANRSGPDGPADLAVSGGPPPTEAALTTSTLVTITTTASTVPPETSTVVRATSTKPSPSTTLRAVSASTIPPRPGIRPTTTVTVLPRIGQGQSLPKVWVAQGGSVPGHENDYLYVALIGWADDADGFVRTLLLDWGDGSPEQTLPGDSLGCRPNGATGWPGPSSAMLSRTPPVWHQYYEKLTFFTVTLTAVSTGCDGSQEQRGSASLQIFVPAGP